MAGRRGPMIESPIFQHHSALLSDVVMVNFMCQLDWCPDIRSNLILSVL